MSAAAATTTDERKPRHLMTHTLSMAISPARCQSHMKANLTPPNAETDLAEKRAAHKAATGAAAVAIKAEIDAITATIVRIGGDAPVAMAAMADFIVKSAMRHSMDQTMLAKYRMADVSSLHAGDPTVLDFWPLVCNLEAIKTFDPENEAALKVQRAAANKVLKEAREKAKESGAAEPPPPKEEEGDGHGPTTTFHTYVDSAMKCIKGEEKYTTMRVAHRLRDVLSAVVAELVERFSLIAKVSVIDFLGVRTLNAKHLQAIIKIAFIAKTGDEADPGMLELLAYIDAKVDLYNQHLASEKDRKLAEMEPAKKAELEAKEAEAAKAKKKRETISMAQKAQVLAQKAKKSAEEIKAAEAAEVAAK
jgi:hypothetical protein